MRQFCIHENLNINKGIIKKNLHAKEILQKQILQSYMFIFDWFCESHFNILVGQLLFTCISVHRYASLRLIFFISYGQPGVDK